MIEDYELQDEEVYAILENYRQQRLKESLIGPSISFVFHVALLFLLSFYVVAKQHEEPPAIEVEIVELEIKEIVEPIEQEIIEVEPEDFTDQVPEMDVPDMVSELTNDTAVDDVSDEAPETEDDLDMEEVLDVVNNPTSLKIPSMYGGRTKTGISSAVKRFSGTDAGQDAVEKALAWLARVQLDNGSWENDPAHSGLALLCFLARGETPLSDQYGITVQKAIQWLATNMPENVKWNRAYSHGIATYAISEAYGMTQIPFLRTPMENGIDVIIKGQQANGGFDYHYKKGARWDVSVAGWQMQAMKAAYVAGSYNEDLPKAIEKSTNFMKNVAFANYRFGYTSPGSGSHNMTGIGTVGLQLLGERQAPETLSAYSWILQNREPTWDKALNDWEAGGKHMYGWYYDTQAVFQNDPKSKEWKNWSKKFQTVLVRHQHNEGYWTFDKEHHGVGGQSMKGKVLCTTLSCLQLEVFYRYLPTFKLSKEKFIKVDLLGEGGGDLIIK